MGEFYYNQEQESYDAIVVGTGISGGWAAKELCEKGLKTLVLERGPMVKHIEDYTTAHLDPWDFPHQGQITSEQQSKQLKQARTGYTTRPEHSHWFVNDLEHPYNEIRRFDWMRGYQVGGRSITWGRHSYRFNEIDFKANIEDGHGVDWPVRYKDIAPWYDMVESYIGVTGEMLGLPQLPDGKFEPMMELNCAEQHVRDKLKESYEDRIVTAGRVAHINSDKKYEGRVRCQFRNRCMRGCPFGAYFSSLSSTMPAAERTGNLTLRPDAIVHEVIYDPDSQKATGVRVIDRETNETFEFKAKVIFLCASAIASTAILMQSKSDRFPNGMGNDSDQLGRNLMDHHLGSGARGKLEGYEDKFYKGRKPGGIYIPRFRNLGGESNTDRFVRGYGYQGGGSRNNWEDIVAELSHGKSLKESVLRPGGWQFGISGFGEVLPYEDNIMTLDYDKTDKWGLPTVTFDAGFKDNEWKMREDIKEQAFDMLTKAGLKEVEVYDDPKALGIGIHEMGTARMGRDPKTSVLNGFNQVHAVKNVYVTDGAFMTSSSCVNPSLTYMAFTARAANHAAEELKKGNI